MICRFRPCTEGVVRLLDAVKLTAGSAAAEGGFPVNVQIDRQHRHRAIHRRAVDIQHRVHAKLTPAALICHGRIHKAVAQHRFARLQRWADDLPHMLRTRRGVENRLGRLVHCLVFRVKQQRANLLAYGASAGFTAADDLEAPAVERILHCHHLRRFAAAVHAFY